MSKALLELNRVNKIYRPQGRGAVQAVRDFTLSVNPGEIVALLGSSGCGKTSTLRMIAGFEDVSQGSIHIDGRAVHTLPPAQRNVAMAFEGYSLYPPLTVRENIALSLKSQGIARATLDERVGAIAHLLEIEDILGRYPSSISAGQQQRASLGRALIRRTCLHLLDEPMGQLEPQLRALLRGRIKHYIKEHALTAILVTHDQTEANALADRIAVMEDGLLQQFDAPEAIKSRPANLFTGTFIGEPPMNVFEAEVLQEGRRLAFALANGAKLEFAKNLFTKELRGGLLEHGHVKLGVRPHAVRLLKDGSGANIFANQWLGDQSHIAAQFAGGTIISVVHDRVDLANGANVGVEISPEDLHVFDRSTGSALSHGGILA